MKWLGSIARAVTGVVARIPSIVRGASRAVDEVGRINDRAQDIARLAETVLPADRALQLRAAAATANLAVNRLRTAARGAERVAAIADANAALDRVLLLADPARP